MIIQSFRSLPGTQWLSHPFRPIHRDPFDRMLVAQAQTDNLILLTADRTVARYPGPVQLM